MIEIKLVDAKELKILRKISIITFKETFSDQNTLNNMEEYLNKNMSLGKLKNEINHPNSFFYFVHHKNELIGYVKLNFKNAQREKVLDGKAFEIERIYLLKSYQEKGLGRRLFEKIFNLKEVKNYHKVWLGVWEYNYNALSFYKKLGFKYFDKHKFILGSDIQNDVLMKLEFKNH